MSSLRKYLVKCSVTGGAHIKTFDTLEDAQFYCESLKLPYQTGQPHIYKLMR